MPKAPTATELAKLREPFPPNQISKLPKETRKQIDERKTNSGAMVWNCKVCGGHHHKDAVHLDYVGHAALTDRLLDVDPEWSWEPVGFTPEGLPALDRNGGLWIKLTVCGMTRYGYGAADGKSGGDAIKEIIGDALRNAAMRFGAALDLWHKGDLHAEDEADEPAPGAVKPIDEPRRSPTPSLEPKEGWAKWALDLQAKVATASDAKTVEKLRSDEDVRIRALRTIDQTLYRSIGKSFVDKRAALQPEPEKEAA